MDQSECALVWRRGWDLLILYCLGAVTVAFGEIVITTDKSVYTIGEVVHLEATNTGPLPEQFVSAPYNAPSLDVGSNWKQKNLTEIC